MKLAEEEFDRDRNIWQRVTLDRFHYREQQFDKIADRQRDMIVQFTAASLGAAGIGIPILATASDAEPWLIILEVAAALLLFGAAFLGIWMTLRLLGKDRGEVGTVMEHEGKLLGPFLRKAVELLDKAKRKVLTGQDIQSYYGLRGNLEKEFVAVRKSDQFIEVLYIVFLTLLLLGITLLVATAAVHSWRNTTSVPMETQEQRITTPSREPSSTPTMPSAKTD